MTAASMLDRKPPRAFDLRAQHPSGSSKLRIPRFGYEVAAYSLLHSNENEQGQDLYEAYSPTTARCRLEEYSFRPKVMDAKTLQVEDRRKHNLLDNICLNGKCKVWFRDDRLESMDVSPVYDMIDSAIHSTGVKSEQRAPRNR
ncbi:hypothetical protein PRZ48_005976 [Zasmidium cellare]|uniref:Uncharacterized protein n=1 Tax=Zasmidium cellare TaxID=395010 RepID=A0ABR0EN17_ZASCE|nr:hypothetical protein PRZ48_005976 [Zasmidium cellare]